MAKKRIQPSRAIEPPHIDTIQLIDGIGPAIEKRLHSIGIYTFAQLAALSPADIAASVADIAGLTTERIIKQDWIGQARRLASELQTASKQAEVAGQDEEPLVPDARVVEETVVAETTVEEEVIAEPEQETLVAPQPDILPLRETDLASTHRRTVEPGPTLILVRSTVPRRVLAGTLSLRELKLMTSHPYEHTSIVRHNQPFRLSVTLDARQIVAAPEARPVYEAIIYGRQISTSQRQKMGEARGNISIANDVAVEVEGIANSPGFYRLEVMVTLFEANASTPGLIAMIEGGPLNFY